ncbi:MAG: MTH1187 family thiamine-binding protein, partial [Dehalococcoidia bacterium]|nr:MTH1187 family thiamine-binding protein [Dehalococcoidia bacterium]
MKGQVVAELAIVPIGTGDAGVSHYVAACLEILEGRKDLSYQLTPMGTVIEGYLDVVLEVT